MRLDIYLFGERIFQSREKARQAILNGGICVNGKLITKPSFEINCDDEIVVVKDTNPFVGRGGIKLQGAIDYFNINLEGVTALDIGASTGGFTDCMLKNGAKCVCACDVGRSQLASVLKEDKRVMSLENTDIRELAENPEAYGISFKFEFVTIDVSFISATKILPVIKPLLASGGKLVCLIKPQFETGNKRVGKKGVIKDAKIHKQVCDNIKSFASELGYSVEGIIASPIEGGDGNKEFLMVGQVGQGVGSSV